LKTITGGRQLLTARKLVAEAILVWRQSWGTSNGGSEATPGDRQPRATGNPARQAMVDGNACCKPNRPANEAITRDR
jgi:hypothetical protein